MKINYKDPLDYPLWDYKFTKGIGFWVGLNFSYGNLCMWLPFLIFYIALPKFFRRKQKSTIVDKKYFWYDIRPNSFGFYFDFQNYYGLRLPFFDIYLKKQKERIV